MLVCLLRIHSRSHHLEDNSFLLCLTSSEHAAAISVNKINSVQNSYIDREKELQGSLSQVQIIVFFCFFFSMWRIIVLAKFIYLIYKRLTVDYPFALKHPVIN